MIKRVRELIEHYKMFMLPVENTYISEEYVSKTNTTEGLPVATTMYGLYCNEPYSHSCFHRLSRDEIWSFFEGEPIELFLLQENGALQRVVLGSDLSKGQRFSFAIPAGTLQGGCLCEGGSYALYGCTVAPGFTYDCFDAPKTAELLKKYPQHKEIIEKLQGCP